MRMRLSYIATLLGLLSAPAAAQSSTETWLTSARQMIGKPILSTVVAINNSEKILLHRVTPSVALFAAIAAKNPQENVDDLRKRAAFMIQISTCPDAKSFDDKIAVVSIWENLEKSEKDSVGRGLQGLLEKMNTPPSLTMPTTIRPPRTPQSGGVVFEYTRDAVTEIVGLVNEGNELKINWTVANSAICQQ